MSEDNGNLGPEGRPGEIPGECGPQGKGMTREEIRQCIEQEIHTQRKFAITGWLVEITLVVGAMFFALLLGFVLSQFS